MVVVVLVLVLVHVVLVLVVVHIRESVVLPGRIIQRNRAVQIFVSIR